MYKGFSLTFFLSSLIIGIVSCTSIPNKDPSNLKFNLNIKTSDKNKELIIETIIEKGLNFVVNFDEDDAFYIQDDLQRSNLKYFCESFVDAQRKKIENLIFYEKNDKVKKNLIVYTHEFKDAALNLKLKNPSHLYILLDRDKYETQIEKILKADVSKQKFSEIQKLDMNSEIEHTPRIRNDISNIYFITDYDSGKSIVPVFRNLSTNINFYSTSQIFETADDLNKLIDFENTLIPIGDVLMKKISTEKDSSIKSTIENFLIKDFIQIEMMHQTDSFNQNVNLSTGTFNISKNKCISRNNDLWKVKTNSLFNLS
tara:strand:- start:29721 stop:30659 length:939 start_codon:yes stop_codon:yes gene_type:complete